MTAINSNNSPDIKKQQQTQPSHSSQPAETVSTSDSQAFSDLVSGEKKNSSESKSAEKNSAAEQELRDLISKSGFQQFMERSKELTEEMKKNFEG